MTSTTKASDAVADIPGDILAAAEVALDNLLCQCVEASGSAEAFRKDCITDIAKAILAERQRCAKIAEGSAKGFDFQRALADGDDMQVGAKSVQLAIASAIRGEA